MGEHVQRHFSRKERRDIIEKISHLIAMYTKEHKIVTWVHETYGLARRSIKMRYIPAAKTMLKMEASVTDDMARVRALEFYKSIVSDTKMDALVRIRAQERLDKIHGLEAPTRVYQHNVGAQKIRVEFEGDDWRREPFLADMETKDADAGAENN